MLRFIKTFIFTLFLISSYSQVRNPDHDTLRITLTKVFQMAKRYAVYHQQVDWNKLQGQVLKDPGPVLNYEDFKRRIQLLFTGIGDRHAALYVNGDKISANVSPLAGISNSFLNELKRSNTQLRTQILESDYGYILVPSNNTGDNLSKIAQAIQDSLCNLLKYKLKGIIIDLRANEGGSIYPMFTGLSQLIGDGVFGAFNNIDGTNRVQWKLKNGKFYQRGKIVASVKTNCSCSQKMKVAVLLGQVTASAGEMVAIALKGRKNTIFIGEKTYGLTTGNVTFKIDGYLLALSASFTEDRTGNVYNSSVLPDIEIIGGDNFSDIAKDKKVLAAIKWFTSGNSSLH